jgi:hypothetical protein
VNRFERVLQISNAPERSSLIVLARALVSAIEETEVEGMRQDEDPSIMVLGAFIAFHTHADVNTVGGYHRLLEQCETRLSATPAEMQ